MKYAALSLVVVGALVFWMLADGSQPRAPRAPNEATGRGAMPVDDPTPTIDEPSETIDRELTRWRITYLGPGGAPLVGVPVDPVNARSGGRTNEAGVITIDAPATVEKLRVRDPYTRFGRRFEEHDATVRLDRLLPLRLEFRTADTGERVSVSNVRIASEAGDMAIVDNRMELSPFEVGGFNRATVAFELPPGYTSVGGAAFEFWAGVARNTREVDATITLWPELELTVIARDLDEQPIEGATISAVYLCAQYDEKLTHEIHVEAAPTDGDGRTRVRGVPYLPGFPLTVMVDGGDSESPGVDQIRMTDREASMTIDCTVDPSVMPGGNNSAIGIGGGKRREPDVWGTAVIEARYRDGTPAAGAAYRLGRESRLSFDELGRASVGKRKPGTYTVWLCEGGRVPTRATFEIKAGETTQVSLREEQGWSLRVRTVDAEGNPLPYRPLSVFLDESSAPYALVVGGVQSIPIQTGADGTVVLPNLGQETMRVGVRIAGRTLTEAKLPYDPDRREVVLTIP